MDVLLSPSLDAGYLAFGEGCPSDHRTVWAGVTTSSLLGLDLPVNIPKVCNRLNTKDPRLINKYQQRVLEKYKQQRIFSRLSVLNTKASYQFAQKDEIETLYNNLDADIINIRREVERKLRKVRRGQDDWSPPLQQIRDKVNLWNLMQKQKSGCRISRSLIRRTAKKCDISNHFELSLADCTLQLQNARKILKESKIKHPEWRDSHIDSLMKARAKANDSSCKTEYKK